MEVNLHALVRNLYADEVEQGVNMLIRSIKNPSQKPNDPLQFNPTHFTNPNAFFTDFFNNTFGRQHLLNNQSSPIQLNVPKKITDEDIERIERKIP